MTCAQSNIVARLVPAGADTGIKLALSINIIFLLRI
jgi:hypothetical protein